MAGIITPDEFWGKVLNPEVLPTDEEAVYALDSSLTTEMIFRTKEDPNIPGYKPKTGFGVIPWSDWCAEKSAYQIFTEEFVDELASLLRGLKTYPIVEIGAGNGKLSYQLRSRGIDIVATDDHSWNCGKLGIESGLVEDMDHITALRIYEPKLVIGSWLLQDTTIGDDVLGYSSVKYFVVIGPPSVTWWGEDKVHGVVEQEGWRKRRIGELERYSIGGTDTVNERKSQVFLFYR